MKNTFGSSVCITLFGESHGPKIGAVLDGMAPGIPVDEDLIRRQLTLRRPVGRISTARQEQDAFEIVSGVFEGRTTGTPSGRYRTGVSGSALISRNARAFRTHRLTIRTNRFHS